MRVTWDFRRKTTTGAWVVGFHYTTVVPPTQQKSWCKPSSWERCLFYWAPLQPHLIGQQIAAVQVWVLALPYPWRLPVSTWSFPLWVQTVSLPSWQLRRPCPPRTVALLAFFVSPLVFDASVVAASPQRLPSPKKTTRSHYWTQGANMEETGSKMETRSQNGKLWVNIRKRSQHERKRVSIGGKESTRKTKGQHWIQEVKMEDIESTLETRSQSEKQWVNIGANESTWKVRGWYWKQESIRKTGVNTRDKESK